MFIFAFVAFAFGIRSKKLLPRPVSRSLSPRLFFDVPGTWSTVWQDMISVVYILFSLHFLKILFSCFICYFWVVCYGLLPLPLWIIYLFVRMCQSVLFFFLFSFKQCYKDMCYSCSFWVSFPKYLVGLLSMWIQVIYFWKVFLFHSFSPDALFWVSSSGTPVVICRFCLSSRQPVSLWLFCFLISFLFSCFSPFLQHHLLVFIKICPPPCAI